MEIYVKNGNYFDYGNRYYVEFKYNNPDEQDNMFELFNQYLIPSYGAHSSRIQRGEDYIMPYLVDDEGNLSVENTRKIGGTSIPEDLLPEFIRRFVEVDGAVVKIGDEEIKGKFNYNQFNKMISNLGLKIVLKKGEYFEYGDRYYIEFKYGNTEQQDNIFELFDQYLIPSYGAHSSRIQRGEDYILPYLIDDEGNLSIKNTKRIGGTSIPEDLLPEFIRRFVEVDGAVVKIGDEEIRGIFNYNQFNELVSKMNGHKTR